MGDYMLTAIGRDGWRDVQVLRVSGMREAISLAERVTGCLVSHGVGGRGDQFHPDLTIHGDTGQVQHHHKDTPTHPVVELGPPEVMAAIARAVRPPKSSVH